ncbi:hypothetical protein GQ457_11G024740 [Hibiscus cannabinus]
MSVVVNKAKCNKVLGGDFNAIRNRGERSGCKGLFTIGAAFWSVWLARRAEWSPPMAEILKLNVDMAAEENKAGCRGILRNEEGILRALFSGPIEGNGVDFAELMAIKASLELFFEPKWIDKVGDGLVKDGLLQKEFFKAWCSWIAADGVTSSLVVEVTSWSVRKVSRSF